MSALVQLLLITTSLTAVGLMQFGGSKAHKWAQLIGLSSQPMWFLTLEPEQWGAIFNTVAFTGLWVCGVYKHWLLPLRR